MAEMSPIEAEHKAGKCRAELRKCAVELQSMREKGVHRAMGYTSFEYFATECLGLSVQDMNELLETAKRCTR